MRVTWRPDFYFAQPERIVAKLFSEGGTTGSGCAILPRRVPGTGGPDEALPSAARSHHAPWRRSGVAAFGARAAGQPRAADRRAHGGRWKRSPGEVCRLCIHSSAYGPGLDRWPQHGMDLRGAAVTPIGYERLRMSCRPATRQHPGKRDRSDQKVFHHGRQLRHVGGASFVMQPRPASAAAPRLAAQNDDRGPLRYARPTVPP